MNDLDRSENRTNETWTNNTLPPFTMQGSPPGYDEVLRLADLSVTLNTYLTPIAVVLGLILNILLIYTIRTTRFKNIVFSVVLVCVASGNLGYLLVYFLNWLESLRYQVITNPGVCQIFLYLSNCFNFLPNWYLLGVLAERCRALCIIYMNRPPGCKFRVRLYLSVITCLPFFVYIVSLWATEVTEPFPGFKLCSAKKRYGRMYRAFMKADPWLTLAMPMVGIVLLLPFNVVFFVIQRFRTRHIRQGRDRKHAIAVAYRDEKWYTISVFLVVIVHLALTLPKDTILLKNILSEPTATERPLINIYVVVSHLTRVTQPLLFIIVNKVLRRRLRDMLIVIPKLRRFPWCLDNSLVT